MKLFTCLFWSPFGILPRRDISIRTVIGKAIKLPKLERIRSEDIEMYHKIYVDALVELHDKYSGEGLKVY